MGPDFPLQRIRVQSQGYVTDPVISEQADCETLHPKHPDFVQSRTTIHQLSSDSYVEPGQCENSE